MNKFTNQLPPNYENDATGYVLNLDPDPDAVSTEYRMVQGEWKLAPGPDHARREGIVTTVRGRNLGAYDRQNREEGKRYTWCPLADYFAQPDAGANPASNAEGIETLRKQVRAEQDRSLYLHAVILGLRDGVSNALDQIPNAKP